MRANVRRGVVEIAERPLRAECAKAHAPAWSPEFLLSNNKDLCGKKANHF
jgi:hypothetical protein